MDKSIVDQGLVEDISAADPTGGFDVANSSTPTGGNDTITTNDDDQIIDALAGDDSVSTGAGADLIYGGSGNDNIFSATGADTLYGGDDDDQLVTSSGSGFSSIYGDDGNDTIFSGASFDFIYGGDGDDLIDSQAQSPVIHDFIWAGAGNDSVIGTNFNDGIRGDEGNDTINANGGNDVAFGGDGDDSINGGSGEDIIEGGLNNDTINGGSGNDTLRGDDGNDWLIGSTGRDLYYGGDGQDTLDLTPFTSVPTIDLALGSIGTSTGRLFSIENYLGSGGSDVVFGSDLFDNSLSGLAGNDTLVGRAGNDTLVGGGGADSLDGGAGTDDVVSYENAASGVIINLATNSASGSEAQGDIISGFEHIIGSASADLLTGSSVSNSIQAGDGDDTIFLQDGGADEAYAGDGNDGIFFGDALNANDIVDAGDGDADQLALQGDYSGGLTLGANNTVGVEQIVLLPGDITAFGAPGTESYSYDLTLINANIEAGQQLILQANQLRGNEDFSVDASAEQDGTIFTFAGLGAETIVGSQGNDAFFFGTGRFGEDDRIDGRSGTSDAVGLQGDYSTAQTLGPDQLVDIEVLALLSNLDMRFGNVSTNPFIYNLIMNDGNVAAGETLIVVANTLLINETLTFDGSAEMDGSFEVFSGDAPDQIIGSESGDVLSGRGAADTLTGLGGDDTFLYTNVTDSQGSGDQITDFTTGDKIGLSGIDANVGLGGDQAFSFIGSAGFSNSAGQVRAVNTGGDNWRVEADNVGDGNVDLRINVTVADGSSLDATDFIL